MHFSPILVGPTSFVGGGGPSSIQSIGNVSKPNYYISFGTKRIPLVNRQTLVGRNTMATIQVGDPSIAKDHAIIELDETMANPTLM